LPERNLDLESPYNIDVYLKLIQGYPPISAHPNLKNMPIKPLPLIYGIKNTSNMLTIINFSLISIYLTDYLT